MRNILLLLAKRGLVVGAIVVHWLLDDLLFFIPTVVVDAISSQVFALTGNKYRWEEWKAFWNKTPEGGK